MSTVDRTEDRAAESATIELEPLVAAMRTVATSLLQDLEGAAQALQKSGQLPKESLADSIHSLRGSFRALWSTLEQHATFVGIQVESTDDDLSLRSIEALLEQIEVRQAEIRHGRHTALALVTRVSELRATTDSAAKLLWIPRSEAEQLVTELASDAPVDTGRLDELNSDSQPFTQLLTLIDAADDLDDSAWERSRSAVADAFGPDLATAAARGRIIAPPVGASEPTASSDAPDPPASVAPVAPVAMPEPTPAAPEPAMEPMIELADGEAERSGGQAVEAVELEPDSVEPDSEDGAASDETPTSRRWRRRRR
jgi:hypothetical protein